MHRMNGRLIGLGITAWNHIAGFCRYETSTDSGFQLGRGGVSAPGEGSCGFGPTPPVEPSRRPYYPQPPSFPKTVKHPNEFRSRCAMPLTCRPNESPSPAPRDDRVRWHDPSQLADRGTQHAAILLALREVSRSFNDREGTT